MLNSKKSILLLAFAALVASAIASTVRDGRAEHAAKRQAEPSPAGVGARFPSLARIQDGRIAMVWSERGSDSVTMVRASVRSPNGTWSSPSTIVRDSTLFINFADVPRIEWIGRNELVATWLQRSGAGKYDYGLRVGHSRDGGKTWTRSAPPHDTTEAGEHGFASLVPMPNARMAVTFLNGHSHGAPGGGTQVALAEFDSKGVVTKRATLDARACDCCQTAATMTSNGLVVAYRDRSPDEIRDIAVTRQVNGAWTEPTLIARDRWKISGCPVNGPAIASDGLRVAVAWFAAARDTAKVQLALSNDGGKTFSDPIRIDGGAPVGHVDVIMNVNGSAIVSWLERTNGERLAVKLRRVSTDRTTSTPITLGEVQGVRPSGWPSMVPNDGGVLVAWTIPGVPARIQLQQITGAALR